jgi:alpha-galactosidase
MVEYDESWIAPVLNIEEVGHGDMPGDQVKIGDSHINRANVIFPYISSQLKKKQDKKIVVSVFGGSGVGKSEIGSLLAHYCRKMGFPAYVLSGDNYPHRIPAQNDAERLNRFRSAGLAAIAMETDFRDEWDRRIHSAWTTQEDAAEKITDNTEFHIYREAGKKALEAYLGTDKEINFDLINSIIGKFKAGEKRLVLKRMGRTSEDMHFQSVDFDNIKVLLIEWTHGNNPFLTGIDFPVFLHSTPEETLAHRLSRGRDKGVDSPFTKLVLDLEQKLLNQCAETAKLIVRKDGRILPFEELKRSLML